MLMVLRLELVGPVTSQRDLMHCVMKAGISSSEKQRHLSLRRRLLIHTTYQDCTIRAPPEPMAIHELVKHPYVESHSLEP
jgi:hypothetical protein